METKDQILVDQNALVDLALYTWRLGTWLSGVEDATTVTVPRYVLRGLNKLLDQFDVTTLDITGDEFDCGLACDVVDTVETEDLPKGRTIVGETVSPMISINGCVARHGQVILHVGQKD